MFPTNSIQNPFLPNMSVQFLANLMVKLHEGVAWSAEEVQTLQVASGLLTVHESRRPSESVERRVVKKIKTVESQHNTPIPTQLVAPPVEEFTLDAVEGVEIPEATKAPEVETKVAEAAKATEAKAVETKAPEVKTVAEPTKTTYTPPPILSTHCIARKVTKDILPGTEANPVYKVKQCPRFRGKDDVLCSKCNEFLVEWKSNPKKKGKWEGALNETPLDHLHVMGSKWYHEKYPSTAATSTTVSVAPIPVESIAPIPEPVPECVLMNVPAKEVKWATLKIGGVHYIYNLLDRRVYRADITQEGEDQIMWESFEGKWRNGEIDPHCEETEDPCYDD